MTCELIGSYPATMVRDKKSYRTYKVKFLIRCSVTDGPANASQTPGLPVYGEEYLILGDEDLWAYCMWDATFTPVLDKEANTFYVAELMFTTNPDEGLCRTTQVEDPLLEPMKVSGGSCRYSEEATHDRWGMLVNSSSHEQIRGQQVEFDKNRSTVTIEQNVAQLQLGLCSSLIDHVNTAPLWGLPFRCVKLSDFSWERKFKGVCQVYFTRRFTFDTSVKPNKNPGLVDPNTGFLVPLGADCSGFDRDVMDEGTKALHGENRNGLWILTPVDSSGTLPDPANPLHFVRYKDANGENARVVLDGHGQPITFAKTPGTGTGTRSDATEAGSVHVEYYPGDTDEPDQAGFLSLGIPTDFSFT